MKIKTLLFAIPLLFILGTAILPKPAHADLKSVLISDPFKKVTTSSGQQTTVIDPRSLAQAVINVLLGFLGTIALCMLLWAGYLYLTAGGDSDKVEEAQHIITYAVIGLLIIAAAWGLTTWIINLILTTVRDVPSS